MYSEDFELFEPVHFLELSEELYEKMSILDSKNSAIKRTIVNRAYYAAFLYIREWLISEKEYVSKGPIDHSKVPNEIIGNTPMFEFFEKDLRDKLIGLGKNRRYCDYSFDLPSFEGKNGKYFKLELSDLIHNSRELISKFEKF